MFQRDSQSGASIWHISMRMDQAPFNDVRVRRAISMGFNRKGIIDGIYAGQAQNLLPFPSSDSTPTFPPIRPSARRTIASPIPVPG